jgi:cysteine desulfurase/selenocysteine lyase
LVDACQSAGQYPLDVEKIQCDFLSATGRKYLRAPRGTGFLYARQSALARVKPKIIDLHGAKWTGMDAYEIRSDARQFELWEGNRAAQIGLKRAIDYVNDIGIDNIWQRVQSLALMVREGLKEISFIECHDRGTELSGIVSFTVKDMTGLEIQNLLFDQGINVSWNGSQNTLMDMKAKGLSDITRCSVHYYNTEPEVYDFLEALKKMG